MTLTDVLLLLIALILAIDFACRLVGLQPKAAETTTPPPIPQLAPNPVRPPGIRTDLVEVLRFRDGAWLHHGWAQAGSEAHNDALNRCGFAVREHGRNDLEYGNQ